VPGSQSSHRIRLACMMSPLIENASA
jgi:hypothetical protein